MGENHFAPLPTAVYGVVLLLAAIAYTILQPLIVARGRSRRWRRAVGSDLKGKLSLLLYLAAIPLAFVDRGSRSRSTRWSR